MLVLGAAGATRILNSVAQVILNHILFGMDVEAAVNAPRIDCQGDEIQVQARVPLSVCKEIAMYPDTGSVTGAADSGGDNMAVCV